MAVEIIGECSSNHGGDIVLAKEFVHACAEHGADFVKFQTTRVKHLSPADPQYEWFAKAELSDDAHHELKAECEKAGVKFLTTVYNAAEVPFLASLGLEAIKIGSGESTNVELRALAERAAKRLLWSQHLMNGPYWWELVKHTRGEVLACVARYPASKRACLARKTSAMQVDWRMVFVPSPVTSEKTPNSQCEICGIVIVASESVQVCGNCCTAFRGVQGETDPEKEPPMTDDLATSIYSAVFIRTSEAACWRDVTKSGDVLKAIREILARGAASSPETAQKINQDVLGALAIQTERAEQAEAETDRLRAYVRHKPDCHIAVDHVGEYINCYRPIGGCDCGLDALLHATPPKGDERK